MTVLLFLLSCCVILLVPAADNDKKSILLPLPTIFISVVESFHLDHNYVNNNNIVGLAGITTRRIRQQQQPSRSYSSNSHSQIQLQMCICIDCQLVTSCKAYHFVEQKHEQPHMTETPTFLPREGSPTIQVNIRTEKVNEEDMIMWKDRIAQQQQALDMEQQHQEYLALNNNNKNSTIDSTNNNNTAIATTTISNTTTTTTTTTTDSTNSNSINGSSNFVAVSPTPTKTKTTIEYDVVKCADFVLEKHCWMNNMPEEIKRVNPDFVPS